MGVQMKRMLAGAIVAAAGLVTVGPAGAQEQPGDTARVHVVRRGDTLWDLARMYLESPFHWRRIYEANQGVVENPHWIFPSERLLIPGLPGLLGRRVEDPADPGYPGFPGLPPEDFPRTVFYPTASTEGRRTLLGPDDIPSPAVAAGEFYTASVLAPRGTLGAVGRLVEVLAPSVMEAPEPDHALPFQKVYMVLPNPAAVERGQMLQIVREGRRVRPFGIIHEPTGVAQVVEIDGATATLEVQELYGPLSVGDLAVPLPDFTVPLGIRPVAVTPTIEGELIAFVEQQPVYSVQDIGFVDIGSGAGLAEGDVLEAIIDPERRRWGIRPEIRVARLQVVRVSDRTAAVQVISMEHPAIEPGMRVRLVAKMPAS
jgi:hypothetical protein